MAATKDKTIMRISYNAPVILTFTLLCLAVTILGMVSKDAMYRFFSVQPGMNMASPVSWPQQFSFGIGQK